MNSLDASVGLWMIRRCERLNNAKVSATISDIIRLEGGTVIRQQQSWCPISGNPSTIKLLPYLVCIFSLKFLNLNLFRRCWLCARRRWMPSRVPGVTQRALGLFEVVAIDTWGIEYEGTRHHYLTMIDHCSNIFL
eukprot:Blabericola_migrator_1__4755@NODE_2502_length_2668_cov_13_771626_g1566_i1_p3_GENE_NODE_2502_length_2668_cov_13_771626_g1566_i1NODE_2502_length_2668_cov_13_771626_g1566_i1_p3_ORF_typecomplete_len135_score6_52_NODE_2502_length_2668_cov_13_771626_g1566_i114811885